MVGNLDWEWDPSSRTDEETTGSRCHTYDTVDLTPVARLSKLEQLVFYCATVHDFTPLGGGGVGGEAAQSADHSRQVAQSRMTIWPDPVSRWSTTWGSP